LDCANGAFSSPPTWPIAQYAVFSYRVCNGIRSSTSPIAKVIYPLAYICHRIFTGALCAEIPTRTAIGEGFLLLHGYGIVINERASIGKNVTIFHQVTVGATAKGVPSIGDRVVLDTHSLILVPVRIGSDVTVGAGCVVLKDSKHNTVVAGNPARIIPVDAPGRAKNVWNEHV
jgi:serine acetyltransferase